MFIDFLLTIGGLILLIYGADFLIDGGSAVAKRFNIPSIVIGLTIIAFGTSLPELVVGAISASRGNANISLGNVLGSNIFNILVVLGITSIFRPLKVGASTTRVEIPLTVLSSIVVFLMIWNGEFSAFGTSFINRQDGFILLCFFGIFMAYTFNIAKNGSAEQPDIKDLSIGKSILFILLGLVGLIAGGDILVRGAVNLARAFNVSETIIGLTIIAVGTSAPELTTSIVAARKGQVNMAIGNVVGSNIFNAFLVLGVTSAITPIQGTEGILVDIVANSVASILLFVFLFIGKGREINRSEGIIFLLLYIAYMTLVLLKK